MKIVKTLSMCLIYEFYLHYFLRSCKVLKIIYIDLDVELSW